MIKKNFNWGEVSAPVYSYQYLPNRVYRMPNTRLRPQMTDVVSSYSKLR